MLGVILAVLLVFAVSTLADGPLVADTTEGKVQGFLSSSRNGRRYISFLSIPFAKPPVGSLRFQPPEEPEPWTGIRNAADDNTICIQANIYDSNPKVFGQEDCLYLNIFTHDIRGSAPVILHIHGGGYMIGDKSDYGPQYFMDEDLVVVDVNYRIGIMGFLSFEDSVMPGNQGLKDQNLAIRWVVNNIANFGGDPDKITLVGESAGSGSVWHHIVSPKSKGLFQGAIAESGTAYNLLSTLPPGLPKTRATKLADLTSCTKDTTEEIVSCLQGIEAGELVGTLPHFREWQIDPLLLFAPALEPPGPEEAFVIGPISSWDPSPVPILMGTNAAEGLFRTGKYLNFDTDFVSFNENFDVVAPLSLRYGASSINTDEVTKKIKDYYFNNREITEADWVNFTTAYTDALFTHGIFKGADKHTGDVYFYYFDYLGEFTFGPQNRTLAIGASHFDEVIYLWQTKNFSPLNEDLEFSKKMVKIWTDFAKNGKAKSPDENVHWKTWTAEHHNYLHLSKDGYKAEEGLHEERYKFWNELNYRDKFQ